MDSSSILWDVGSARIIKRFWYCKIILLSKNFKLSFSDHSRVVMDVNFNATGNQVFYLPLLFFKLIC